MKIVKIGIISQKEIRERTLAIARGEYKPKADEPKIWFTSIRSPTDALSDENRTYWGDKATEADKEKPLSHTESMGFLLGDD